MTVSRCEQCGLKEEVNTWCSYCKSKQLMEVLNKYILLAPQTATDIEFQLRKIL